MNLGIPPQTLLTVFIASLVGSLHCLGMCGGFVAFYSGGTSSTKAGAAHLAYNGGRLLTYVVLGLAAGTLGSSINLAGSLSGVQEVAALVAGTLIVAWGGVLLLQARGSQWASLPAPQWLNRVLVRVLPRLTERPPVVRALVLGLTSTMLPCGWLYGFAATAAGTGTPLGGGATMLVFWAGTLPAMVGTGFGLRAAAKVLGPRLGTVMPVMLILVGLFTLGTRGELFPELGPSHCPSEETRLENGHANS